jgi:hypothetical protein
MTTYEHSLLLKERSDAKKLEAEQNRAESNSAAAAAPQYSLYSDNIEFNSQQQQQPTKSYLYNSNKNGSFRSSNTNIKKEDQNTSYNEINIINNKNLPPSYPNYKSSKIDYENEQKQKHLSVTFYNGQDSTPIFSAYTNKSFIKDESQNDYKSKKDVEENDPFYFNYIADKDKTRCKNSFSDSMNQNSFGLKNMNNSNKPSIPCINDLNYNKNNSYVYASFDNESNNDSRSNSALQNEHNLNHSNSKTSSFISKKVSHISGNNRLPPINVSTGNKNHRESPEIHKPRNKILETNQILRNLDDDRKSSLKVSFDSANQDVKTSADSDEEINDLVRSLRANRGRRYSIEKK